MSIFPSPSPTPEPSRPAQAPAPAPQSQFGPPPPPPPQYGPPSGQHPSSQYWAPPPAAAPEPRDSSGLKTGILFAAVVLLAAACGYLYTQINQVKQDLAKNNEATLARLDKVDEVSSLTARTNQRKVDELRDQLERARRQASLLVGDAKQEALKKVEETQSQLQAAQQQAQQAQQQLKSDISQVREQADTANSKISQVDTAVTAVKGDVASTKTELEKTVADLKRATGELDGHSVLIATNGKELAALRALGERTYVEFTVHKAKTPQKVGDVSILLKNADIKKNRYTIELTADDKKTEKKDKGINEPLQFMTSKAKQPYEIVVNDIKKDTIAGYLSIPKVLTGRTGT